MYKEIQKLCREKNNLYKTFKNNNNMNDKILIFKKIEKINYNLKKIENMIKI